MSSTLYLFLNFLLTYSVPLMKTEFYQYHTRYAAANGDHTCFYRHSIEFGGRASYLIPYCIRVPMVSPMNNNSPCFGQNLTFDELKKKNITADHLLKWFAPLDLITDYITYLIDGIDTSQVFCNCSDHDYSFGTHCQYEFAAKTSSFNSIVNATMSNRYVRDVRNLTEEYDMTCYMLWNCTTLAGLCLDWGQICDGRIDCTGGIDEDSCFEKELSECDERTHYRCRSGHCIPRAFAFDLTIDCSEWDDEQYKVSLKHEQSCGQTFSTECDEHSCGSAAFSCGDGVCLKIIKTRKESSDCQNPRDILWIKRIYAFRGDISKECWSHMICHVQLSCLYESPNVAESLCQVRGKHNAQFCQNLSSPSISCSNNGRIFFPRPSFLYPSLHSMYVWNSYTYREDYRLGIQPLYLCFNDTTFIRNPTFLNKSLEIIDNCSCYLAGPYIPSWNSGYNEGLDYAITLLQWLMTDFLTFCYSSNHSQSRLFRCRNGLEISYHRLRDSIIDCLVYGEDEAIDILNRSCNPISRDRFTCYSGRNLTECAPRRLLNDEYTDCTYHYTEDTYDSQLDCGGNDERFPIRCTNEYDCQFFRDVSLQRSFFIVYEELCDGVRYCSTSGIEDDEINCEQWPCHARVHRCNGVWNRVNGCDELNCFGSLTTYLAQNISHCSINEHYCLRFNQTELSCLSVTQAGNGEDDCILAMDERMTPSENRFHTAHGKNDNEQMSSGFCQKSRNVIRHFLHNCDRKNDCPLGDDELWCSWSLTMNCSFDEFPCKNGTCISKNEQCDKKIDCLPSGEDEWICDLSNQVSFGQYQPFTLVGFDTESSDNPIKSPNSSTDNDVSTNEETVEITEPYALFHCHRGILLRSRDGHDVCLCPPSYYGHRCQFQNNRLYLTFRTDMPPIFDQNAIYHLVFVLSNENNQVLALETMVHMPHEQSSFKHALYFLYSHLSNNSLYVHIEAYRVTTTEIESISLSWFYEVQFPFLPVNRLSVKLDLKSISSNKTICHRLACVHGQCVFYINTLDQHFCLCQQGWTGVRCDQRLNVDPCNGLNCDSRYSKCIRHAHRAICLCAMGRIGHTCRIPYNPCDRIRCENNGQCIAVNEPSPVSACLCSIDYYGN